MGCYITMNRQAFAEVLQAPFSPLGRLQKFCKLRFPLWGICRSSASSIFLFGAFAEVLQAPFSRLGHLQKFCKLHFPLWGICRSSASSIFPFGAFAEVLQAPFSPLGHLQGRCKHFRKTKDRDMTSRPPTRRMRGGVTRHEGKNVRSDGGVSGLN